MEKENFDKTNTLDILLQVEAKANAMVHDAQKEADKRIRDNEIKAGKEYEERIKLEYQAQEKSLKEYEEKIKNDYKDILQAYKNELSQVQADKKQFSGLIGEILCWK